MLDLRQTPFSIVIASMESNHLHDCHRKLGILVEINLNTPSRIH